VDRRSITSVTMALIWRLVGLLLLCALWVSRQGDEVGLILVLLLALLGLARWRFRLPAWTTLIDQAACIAVSNFHPDAAFALALPTFDSFLAFRPAYALPGIIAVLLLHGWSLPIAATLGTAALTGISLHLWAYQLTHAQRDADRDRRERYELESLKGELLSANVRIARMAELAERARIARDLHDHAGHEITAAQLAIKAFQQLWREDDAQAEELLDQAAKRVENGMELLRRTVQGMSSAVAVGAGSLEEICSGFSACEVSFCVHGNTTPVPIHAWGVLESCLKEGLTNAVRHETPQGIDVSLDVGPHIVRLSVTNPTQGRIEGGRGIGLRNLSQRAKAVGGSVTTDTSAGFRLVCVLPLDEVRT